MTDNSAGPLAILAGGGALPPLVAASAARSGRRPIVFAIADEADPAMFRAVTVHVLRWGEIGRLFRLTREAGCREAVLVGSIRKRPDFRSIRPDLGAVALIPRIIALMRNGDDSLLTGVARIFEERGLRVVGALDVAPDLALPQGMLTGRATHGDWADIETAAEAARRIGSLDVAQAAVAAGDRIIAVEDSGGTDALLARVADLRAAGQITEAGGVLVKCMKPHQDRRLDVPTIGPGTAELAQAAGLSGVAAEAGHTILAGREETVAAFRRAGLFLFGMEPPPKAANG
ncbi:MAG TPA: UDP-2,3-diacylglucosamine diphosphatase LpxI [Propylenella sp.]